MSEDKPVESKPQDLLDLVLRMPEDQVMPWEEVILPSKGLYYNGAVPDGRVEVRPMGLAAEKILATQRLAQSGKSIDHLFKKCVKFPGQNFDPLNLLAGDRVFLLYYLRGITYGNIYEFIVKCTNEDCGEASTHEYDFNRLSETINRPKPELGEEPFKVVLPHLTKKAGAEFWVKVRLMRGYDMQAMINTRKTTKKIQGPNRQVESIDDTLEESLNMLVMEAMGSADRSKIKDLISHRMHASDTATIREFLRTASPSIDTTITIKCISCSNEMRMELPITESFFRPTVSRSDGK
jgi:hypothetical protein